LLLRRSIIDCRMLAHSAMNVLLMSGGDISAAKLDLGEMITMVSPLAGDGLVHADIILLSAKMEYNGLVLAALDFDRRRRGAGKAAERISPDEIREMLDSGNVREFTGHDGETFYGFTATSALPGRGPMCAGRLVFSRARILDPVVKLRTIIYGAVGLSFIMLSALGYVFGRLISRSADELIQGVERIGGGDMDHVLSVNSHDEFSMLGNTINHFVLMIKMQIQELRRANAELKRLDLLKDEFLTSISHELRTPLYGIIGIAESMLDRLTNGSASAGVDENLSLISVSARRLSHLINNILDYSRLKHGAVDIADSVVDLSAVVEVVISILRPLILQKGITVENRIQAESVYVRGDADRIQQVLLNLIGNSVKFTDQGGISVDCSDESVDGDAATAAVTVSDTGVGLPGGKPEDLFGIYARADSTGGRYYSGSGLGLAIAKYLVELHGGTITAFPNIPRGACFRFTLKKHTGPRQTVSSGAGYSPLLREDEYALGEKARGAASETRENGLVLVIDDEPVIQKLLAASLEQWGYGVVTMAQGQEALDMMKGGLLPDLIILDVMLPRMSGYDVCREIRKIHAPHELPILMLTARGKPEDMVTGLEAGANDYLAKPIERKALHARVQNLISLRKSARLSTELSIIRHDLDMAHHIQQDIMLGKNPEIEGVDIEVRYIPMDELGGDFFNIHRIDDKRIAVLIADVSGHGLPAAFICAMLKVAYMFHLEQEHEPGPLLSRVNASMYGLTGDQYITAFYALIDLEKRMIFQSSAGHWPLLVCGEDGGMRSVVSKGVPFGWAENNRYDTASLDLVKRDRLVFYTDGIIELKNKSGEMFWTENFSDFIKQNRASKIDSFADTVVEKLHSWSGADSFRDDVTLIVLDINR